METDSTWNQAAEWAFARGADALAWGEDHPVWAGLIAATVATLIMWVAL